MLIAIFLWIERKIMKTGYFREALLNAVLDEANAREAMLVDDLGHNKTLEALFDQAYPNFPGGYERWVYLLCPDLSDPQWSKHDEP